MEKNNKSVENAQGVAATADKTNKTNKSAASQAAPQNEAQVRQLGQNLPVLQPKPMAFEDVAKTVVTLNKKLRQLNRLDENLDSLKSFEVKKEEEDIDSTSGYYTGCKLELKDDNGENFLLKNPVLIKEVVKYLIGRMETKRNELKSEIKLPAVAA